MEYLILKRALQDSYIARLPRVACVIVMRFVFYATALLGTITLVASGLIGNTPRGSGLPINRFEIKRNIRQPDGSRSVSKTED